MFSRRSFTLLIACAALTVGVRAAVGNEPTTSENPGITLPAVLNGSDALRTLGPRLEYVAALNRKTPQQLAQSLAQDPDLWVDMGGHLFYTCAQPDTATKARGVRAQAAARASVVAPAPPFPVDTTFQLHSRPASTRKMFLDFDGHTTSGTLWNGNGVGDFTSAPFDLDGNPNSWSSLEYEAIQHVWQRMAEDYAGFDVDVTTEDPGVEALRQTSPGDQNYGKRVVFSPTDAWIGQNPPGGIAYLTSFTWAVETPCYVFTNNVSNVEKFMADAGSHEGGHTLGLNHDGTASQGYYGGQGVWGPIMGAPYGFALTQWNNGDYTGANNQEDDVAVMNTFGVTLKDDYGNTTSAATNITGPSVRVNGVISNRQDVDVFRFQTGPGPVTVSAAPYVFGPNLDIQIDILNSSGTVLGTANPATLDASLKQTLAAGAYYLRVDGVGAGDPLTNGYSDYGSLGYYTLDFTLTPAVAPTSPSNLVATAVASNQIGLSWADNSSSEDNFELERKTGTGSFSRIASPGANATSFQDRNVTSGVTYTYRLRAVNAGGSSSYTNEASATPPFAPPGAPTLVKLTATSATEVDVTWQTGTGIITTFELEDREGVGVFSAAGQFASTVFATHLSGLTPGSEHTARIRAIGPGGTSPWSNLLFVTLPPAAPTDLSVSSFVGGFQVGWSYSGNVTFKLERKIGQGAFVEVARTSGDLKTYRDTGFLSNVTAQYRVRAATVAGDSAYSNVGTATTPAALLSLTLSKASVKARTPVKGTVKLDGAAPAGGALITITADNGSVLAPASVLIPQGETTTTFDIFTKKVSAKKVTVTLTATYGTANRAATLTLKK